MVHIINNHPHPHNIFCIAGVLKPGIERNAAAVRVVLEDWHGIAFTDFHNLLKIDGEWKIVSKVFHQY